MYSLYNDNEYILFHSTVVLVTFTGFCTVPLCACLHGWRGDSETRDLCWHLEVCWFESHKSQEWFYFVGPSSKAFILQFLCPQYDRNLPLALQASPPTSWGNLEASVRAGTPGKLWSWTSVVLRCHSWGALLCGGYSNAPYLCVVLTSPLSQRLIWGQCPYLLPVYVELRCLPCGFQAGAAVTVQMEGGQGARTLGQAAQCTAHPGLPEGRGHCERPGRPDRSHERHSCEDRSPSGWDPACLVLLCPCCFFEKPKSFV